LSDSDVARSDLLRAVIYPDSDDTGTSGTSATLGDGTDNTYDRVEHKYNRQGEVKETKDQNGTVHVFDRDKLGRETDDPVHGSKRTPPTSIAVGSMPCHGLSRN